MRSDVPPEVWANVARQLKQPTPPAGEKDVTWKQLHQHDLASMMRVCKLFHTVTAPVLYSEVVVDKPASLLVGIDAPYPGNETDKLATPPAPFHKRYLLAKITALHYIYSEADARPFGSSFTWPKPPPLGANADKQLEKIHSQIDFSRFIAAGPALDELDKQSIGLDDLFPQLERRTIALWQTDLWMPTTFHHRCGGRPPSSPKAQMQVTFESKLGRQIPIPLAPYSCQNAVRGPYVATRMGVPNGREVRPADTIKINSVHDVRFDTGFLGQIYPGIENHLYVPPRKVKGKTVCDQVISWLQDILECLQMTEQTWLEGNVTEEDLHKTVTTFLLPRPCPPPTDTSEIHETDAEIMMLNFMVKQILMPDSKAAPSRWTDRVSFVWADTVPECKGCGRSNVPAPGEGVEDDEDAWTDEE